MRPLAGPVTVPAGAQCVIASSFVNGKIVVGAGGIVRISASSVTGSVTTTGGAIQVSQGSRVTAAVQAQAPVHYFAPSITSFPFILCERSYSSTVSVMGAPGGTTADEIRIGDSAFSNCHGPNQIRGNVTVSNNVVNHVNFVIQNNVVAGNLTCLNETPAPSVSGNTVSAATTGQCAAT